LAAFQDSGGEKQDDWVKITSSDGYSFLVKRSVAAISGTLKNMLSEDSELPFLLEALLWYPNYYALQVVSGRQLPTHVRSVNGGRPV
jgi:hypothetical protein